MKLTKKELVFLDPMHTAKTLVLVYLCFSVPIVLLALFVAFIRDGAIPGFTVLSALILNALLGFGLLKQIWQRVVFTVWVLLFALGMSALSSALTYGPAHAWVWLGTPALLGLAAGWVLAMALVWLNARTYWAFLLLALLAQQSVLNQAPESAYFAQTLQLWEQGRFIRCHGIVQWLGWLWPFAVLLLAFARVSRERSSPD